MEPLTLGLTLFGLAAGAGTTAVTVRHFAETPQPPPPQDAPVGKDGKPKPTATGFLTAWARGSVKGIISGAATGASVGAAGGGLVGGLATPIGSIIGALYAGGGGAYVGAQIGGPVGGALEAAKYAQEHQPPPFPTLRLK